MRPRSAWLAWSLWATAIALSGVAAALVLITLEAPVPDNWGFRGYWALLAPLLATAGLLIARRQPRNAVGWLLLTPGVAAGFGGFAQEYASYALIARPGSLPFAVPLAWVASWSFAFFACPVLLWIPQLFPTGRALTRRWRPLVPAAALFVPATLIVFGLRPGPLENASFIDNPLGLTGPLEDLRVAIAPALTLLVLLLVLASGASLVVRFRRSSSTERQQLKWVALSGALLAPAMGVIVATTPATGTNTFKLAQVVMILAFSTLPIAIGIAVLRYRLYDIDLIINRTIVYGALSAVLAAAYVAFVVLFQAVLRPITGGSEIAVAASTLAVVALIQPLRDRIQRTVDRRFYRSRYDASRTLDAFVARLRDEVGLDEVRSEVLDVVAATVRPAHAGLWLREGPTT